MGCVLGLGRIVKPREQEIPDSGASVWKRELVGTCEQYYKCRYDTLKDCGYVIYERLLSRNNRRKSLLYHKKGVHCIPHKKRCLSSGINCTNLFCLKQSHKESLNQMKMKRKRKNEIIWEQRLVEEFITPK